MLAVLQVYKPSMRSCYTLGQKYALTNTSVQLKHPVIIVGVANFENNLIYARQLEGIPSASFGRVKIQGSCQHPR